MDDILSRVDIVELISGYLPLKRAGRNYKANCPFHHEKTPSFMVSADRQIYHCFGCFPAGSLVKTEKGFHKIEEIEAGQLVLTHKGRFMPVIRTLWRPYRGEIRRIFVRNSNLPVMLTSDHKVFVIKTKNCKYKSKENRICQWRCKLNCPEKSFRKYQIENLSAKELSINDYLLYPVNKETSGIKSIDLDKYYNRKISNFGPDIQSIPTRIEIGEDFLKLIGYWIAEGSSHRAYIRFSLGNHEKEFAKEIQQIIKNIFHLQASSHIRNKGGKTGIEITACNSKLANIFENICGKGAENKHIPFELQKLPPEIQEVIIMAIFRGDGCVTKVAKSTSNRTCKTITTISLILAEQIKDILLRLGISPVLRVREAKVDKKGVRHRTAYTVSWQEKNKLHFSDIIQINGVSYQILPIRRIDKRMFLGNVYNLTVASDHSYTTPNFVVGNCGAGGNAFNFLIQYERLEFIEAVETLAQKAGVTLPRFEKENPQAVSLATQLYKINELASLFYEQSLNSGLAKPAKDYLAKRLIKEDTIRQFKLGYCLDKWDGLISHLRAKNISISLLEKAGLILSREGGGYYDRFRNRIIFPIFDIKARALGFGARVLDDSLPKYINSPETPVYIKGKNLYGLHLAKDAIRDNDYVVVVEGYLDFIIPYQEGLRNIVASQGTALTQEQACLLKRYTHNIVMLYDGDNAGELATLRSLDIFLDEGMNVKVVSLPEGLDPDAFMRKSGMDKFKERINQAESLFDYKLKILKARHNIREPEGKARIAAEMLPTVNRFKNMIVKADYIRKFAEELGVAEHYVLEELKKIKIDKPYSGLTQATLKKALEINPTEKLLVRLMIEEARLINDIKEHIGPQDFQDKRLGRIVAIMFELADSGQSIEPSKLMNHLGAQDNMLQLVCETAFSDGEDTGDRERVIYDCIARLKGRRLKEKKEQLHEEIKAAQHLGDEAALKQLMQEFHHLTKKG